MRFIQAFVAVLSLAALPAVAVFACGGGGTSSELADAGSATPMEDGAVCNCATPDCLPSCDDLPKCALVCSIEGNREWVDPCGHVQYSQVCAGGCTDASVADAACD